jgi:energy-coupling factor transporter ATPase
LIRISGLTFRYSDTDKPALQDISLEVQDGEFVLITGPSGGGKSSLCRCLNGLIPHFHGGEISGKVEVDGLDTMKHSTKELATKVGMVFQDPENQLVTVDVEREIAFGLENLGFPRELMAKRVEEALDTVGIAGLRHRTVNELSGGEKQRVAIASVLALYPSMLVLDEPTSELDPKGAEEVLNVAERLNDELGITVILVEHRLDRVVQHVDRMIVLDNGRIVSDGTPQSTLSNGKLSERGVEVPPIIKVVQGLRDRGISVTNTPLTVKEGRAALASVVQRRVAERGEEAVGDAPLHLVPASNLKSDGVQPVVDVKALYHVYPGDSPALRNISLKIREGEFVAIMGRNASGKTTLVKHLNGLLKPTKGDVVVDGMDTREASGAELAKKVGYVFQNPNDHLFADSVEQEIAFSLRNLGFERGEMQPMIDQVLNRFGLTQYRERYPRSLSGGEKQRVALASVLVAQPKIVILDEPTRGMEYKLKAELMRYLDDYRKEGRVVILVTQDVETVAEYGDRVILVSEGRIVVDGAKRDLLSQALLFSPQINRLAQSLSHYGIPGTLLTADELLTTVT